MKDNINPLHYKTEENFKKFLEVVTKKQSCDLIDLSQLFQLNGCIFNVFKYLFRAGKKDGEETLKDFSKAIDYINRQAMYENATEEEKERYVKKLESFTEQARKTLL